MVQTEESPGGELAVKPMPWETLFPKQIELFNLALWDECERDHPSVPPCILLDGPRKSTKTIGACFKVLRHMWETPNARVAVLVKIQGTATDGGALNDLIDIVLPLWLEADMGCRYTTFDAKGIPGVRTDSKTRTIYFRISNMYGGESELRLFSLNHDQEAEKRFKSMRFSCVWVVELSNFEDPTVFYSLWQQLRMWHLPPWKHLFISDTNPSDEGDDSWIFEIWHKRQIAPVLGKLEEKDKIPLNRNEIERSLRLLQFKLEDNLALTPAQRQAQYDLYASDPQRQMRDCDGVWVSSGRRKHFADVFMPHIHVVGGGKDEGDQIALSPLTTRLLGGWDIGSSVNHAAWVIEKRMVELPNKRVISTFNVLDGLLHVGEQKRVSELGLEMLQIMEAIEFKNRKRFEWIHYADDSATTVYRPSSGTFDYLEIQAATGGRIILVGVPKPDGSVELRVNLIRRLLFERRLYVSARCRALLAMFGKIKSSKKDFVQHSDHKHAFDALSYPLYMECNADLMAEAFKPDADQAAAEPIHIK